MIEAERVSWQLHSMSLRDYLRTETNRGRSDVDLSREFRVSRHTIHNWKMLLGLVTVRRTEFRPERIEQ